MVQQVHRQRNHSESGEVMGPMRYKKGDVVLVDAGVFIASPKRGDGVVKCEVLEDSHEQQTYVVPMLPHRGSPMYVFNRDISAGRNGGH